MKLERDSSALLMNSTMDEGRSKTPISFANISMNNDISDKFGSKIHDILKF